MLKMTTTRRDELAAAGLASTGGRLAALAASLLAAAALLLAPGAAWACLGFTTSSSATVSCTAATYPVSIRSTIQSNASVTVRVPGGSGPGGTATVITAATIYAGINLLASDNMQTGNYAIDVGTTAAVSIVDDTGSGNESPGLRIRQHGSGTATVDVGSQVTIGTSSSARMRAHGIYVRSSGSAGAATITNAGTIYASYEGIDVQHDGAATTTVTHSGTIDSLNHGIQAVTDGAGALILTSSGGIAVTNANQQGIRMRAQKNGAMTLTATGGAITTTAQGIYMESQGTGTVTIQGTAASAPTQSGPTITSSASHGIHVHKSGSSATAGDISITTTGGSITPATTGNFYGIYVQDRAGYTGAVTINNAADVTASQRAIFVSRLGSGAVTVTNSDGTVLSSAWSAILAQNAANDASTVSVSITGGKVQTTGTGVPAIWAGNRGAGDVSVAIADGAEAISRNNAGIFAELGSYSGSPQMTIAQNGAILGRKGVHARATQHSTDDPVVARQAADQPLVDVTWTGTFSHGNTPDEQATVSQDDNDRFSVTSAVNVPVFAQVAAASTATGGLYDGAAGIEAQVMDWLAVATQVAQGDDPGAFANNAAQLTAVPTGATASDNTYVAQFRALFGNEQLAIASAVFTAIDSSATSLADLNDAEIVSYLRGDNNAVRGLLRNLLRQGLSDKEQAVLAALATGDSDGLTDALDDADAGFSNTYKTAVRALLNRYHVGNVRVAMTGGSIASRGDGIRAYYATPNANNGAISVTVAAGAEVTGGKDGVYVANAGEGLMLARKYTYGYAPGDTNPEDDVAVTHGEGADAVPLLNQRVTVAGMVTGGTGAAVHLNGGGAVIVERGGKVHAGSSGVGILVNDPGPALVYIDGEVKGKQGGAAAVHLTGGGDVIVGLNGKVEANGAVRTIQGGATDATKVTVTLATDRVVTYQEDADDAHEERMAGVYHSQSVAEVRFREYLNGTFTGYGPTLSVGDDGMLDTSGLDPRLCPGDQPRDADGKCPSSPGEPGTGEPGTGEPGTGEPGTGEPGTGEPGTGEPGTGEPGTGEPGTGEPGTGEPGTGEPGTGEPGTGEPGTGEPGTGEPGTGPGVPTPPFSCEGAMDGRCRMYEALPSMLLAMNALPSWAERRSAARDGDGGWARVEASRGKWQAKEATTTSGELAYDHRRSVGRAGVDFLAGESGRVGMSVHGLRGKAEMAGVGEVDLSGMGAGLSATWEVGEFQVDAQAAATWYDADLKSYTHGRLLKKEASGAGYALGVDVGRRMAVGELMVTPRAGFGWSRVDLLDFIDLETAGGARAEVSVEEAGSVQGRLGVTVERELAPSGRVFGSLDVEQEFSDETEVKVGGEMLKTEARPTGVRLGLGGEFAVDENVVLRATGGWQTSGSGTSGYGGGLEVRVRF